MQKIAEGQQNIGQVGCFRIHNLTTKA